MARLLAADAMATMGDETGARAYYLQSIQDNPTGELATRAYEKLGRLSFGQGDHAGAIRELEARLATATEAEGNEHIHLLLAKAYRAADRQEDARDTLEKVIEFFPQSEDLPEAYAELSNVLDDLGEEDSAIRVATQAIQKFPGDARLLRTAITLLNKAGLNSPAWQAVISAHRAGVDDPDLLLAAGKYFAGTGVTGDARDAFALLNERYPGTPQAFEGTIALAEVEMTDGRIEKAHRHLESLLDDTKDTPRELPVLVALGDIYRELGLKEPTRKLYAKLAALTTEPELLAKTAIALFDADAPDEGLPVAERVDVSRVPDAAAYAMMSRQGSALLRVDPRRGLEKLEQAYESYPKERTPGGDRQLIETNLALNRPNRARAIVSELQARVDLEPLLKPQFREAATAWADYLYRERDYRAAADAYGMVLGGGDASVPGGAEAMPLEAPKGWPMYQRANALARLADFDGAIPLLDRVAGSTLRYARDAQVMAQAARLEQELRGGKARPLQSTD